VISVKASRVNWPLKQPFRIARGVEYDVDCIHVKLSDASGNTGRAEALGVNYEGETSSSMLEQIASVEADIMGGASRETLQRLLPAGGARNALDCAMWDLEAKQTRVPAWRSAGLPALAGIETACTVGMMSESELRQQLKNIANYTWLKVKTDSDSGIDPIRIIHEAVPQAKIIVDPNQHWTSDVLLKHQQALQKLNVVLIEQPLPVGEDDCLEFLDLLVPIAADESFTDSSTIDALCKKYDVLNIKLDKTGGLTEALLCAHKAKSFGMRLMVGCMLGSSLSMAPGMLVAQLCDYVDLDGPLLQAADCDNPLLYHGSFVSPPTAALWG
jgi:L-Ala-D/L-Glu epimerase